MCGWSLLGRQRLLLKPHSEYSHGLERHWPRAIGELEVAKVFSQYRTENRKLEDVTAAAKGLELTRRRFFRSL